jgi:hypothetical protein
MSEVKDVATPRPWEGRNDGLIASRVGGVRFVLRVERHGPAATLDDEDRACMGLVLSAVNAYDPARESAVKEVYEALKLWMEKARFFKPNSIEYNLSWEQAVAAIASYEALTLTKGEK